MISMGLLSCEQLLLCETMTLFQLWCIGSLTCVFLDVAHSKALIQRLFWRIVDLKFNVLFLIIFIFILVSPQLWVDIFEVCFLGDNVILTNVVQVGALQDVRSELTKLRGVLFYKILEDLHAHLYNKGEYRYVLYIFLIVLLIICAWVDSFDIVYLSISFWVALWHCLTYF